MLKRVLIETVLEARVVSRLKRLAYMAVFAATGEAAEITKEM